MDLKLSHLFFMDDIVLFGEASMENVQRMPNILNRLNVLAGLKVNDVKSSIIFLPNVEENLKEQICNATGFKVKEKLGKYPGLYLDSKGNLSKDGMNEILEK